MTLLIFFVGLAIWLLLERQAVRHRMEMEMECAQLDVAPPVKKSGLPIPEAWLNVVLGAILAGYSIVSIAVIFFTPDGSGAGEMGRIAVVILATGIVMMGVGGRRIAGHRLQKAE